MVHLVYTHEETSGTEGAYTDCERKKSTKEEAILYLHYCWLLNLVDVVQTKQQRLRKDGCVLLWCLADTTRLTVHKLSAGI